MQSTQSVVLKVGGVIVIMAMIGVAWVGAHRKTVSVVPSETATPQATASATAVPSTEPTVASATPGLSPAPSPALPQSAQAVLTEFYSAYKAKDSARLSVLFSEDTTSELITLHSLLFKGVDTHGNPGGPTLFSSNSAAQSVAGYSVSQETTQGTGWVITLKEQRLSGGGESAGSVATRMVLVPTSAGGWLIDSYTHENESGKYSGFLSQ